MHVHCTVLAAAALVASAAAAGAQQAQPAPGDTAFAIYLRGTQIGREQVTLARNDGGWIITSTGRSAAPIDFTVNRFEMKYGADWQPLEMTLEARVRNSNVIVRTSFTVTSAINEILQNNATSSKTDQIGARTIVM